MLLLLDREPRFPSNGRGLQDQCLPFGALKVLLGCVRNKCTGIITVWRGLMGCCPSGHCSTLHWDLVQRNNIIHLLSKSLPLTVAFPTVRTATTGKVTATTYLMLRHPRQGISIEVFLSIPVLNAQNGIAVPPLTTWPVDHVVPWKLHSQRKELWSVLTKNSRPNR